jgi:uncharacterized membrane protein YqiK
MYSCSFLILAVSCCFLCCNCDA